MTTPRTSFRIARATALMSIPALALLISVSAVEAREGGGNSHGHRHAHGRGHAYGQARVVCAAPPCAIRPVVVRPPVVMRRVHALYRFYAPPVAPYPPSSVPYGAVVYDRAHGGVDGYIGVATPNFGFAIAF